MDPGRFMAEEKAKRRGAEAAERSAEGNIWFEKFWGFRSVGWSRFGIFAQRLPPRPPRLRVSLPSLAGCQFSNEIALK